MSLDSLVVVFACIGAHRGAVAIDATSHDDFAAVERLTDAALYDVLQLGIDRVSRETLVATREIRQEAWRAVAETGLRWQGRQLRAEVERLADAVPVGAAEVRARATRHYAAPSDRGATTKGSR